MTDDVLSDPWGVADEIPELLDGWDPDAEEHPVLVDGVRAEFMRKRLLAVRFRLDEIAEIRAEYDAEIAAITARLQAEIERLEAGRDEQLDDLRRSVEQLSRQLTSMHGAVIAAEQARHRAAAAAAIARGEEPPKDRTPTMIRSPHGTLRSQAGGTPVVTVLDEELLVKWLDENGYGDAVRVKPAVEEQRLPDGRKLPGLVKRAADGTLIGLVDKDGERCPHVEVRDRERAHWIELPDKRSSKHWLDSQP